MGITHILNVAGGPLWQLDNVKELVFPLCDKGSDDLNTKLPTCLHFIDEARNTHGKVLVHCNLGVNRSATVVIAYLISKFCRMSSISHSFSKWRCV
ncbi:hypothetical protein Pelo_19873 [Pelomyxa schiedti]|nr:hypothetical protein Pelo_19873 [Pelomyxa schiedti]